MKIAKKVLSVLLAVAMILSTVAVAASALYGDEDSTYQVKFWLTAAPISYSVYPDEEYAEVDDIGDEIETEDGTIEVQPGDTYLISFYAKTNFVAGMTEGAVYYSSRLLDFKEDYEAQAAAAAAEIEEFDGDFSLICPDKSTGAYTNSSNSYIKTSCKGSPITGLTLRSEMNATAAKQNLFDAVQNEDGTAYFKSGDETKYDLCKWLLCPNYGSAGIKSGMLGVKTGTYDATSSLFSFTVKVPDDAKAGEEFNFFIPKEARKDSDSGYMTCGYCDTTANKCMPADVVAAKMVLGDSQYFDLDGCNLTLKVPGGGDEVDFTGLQTEVAKYTTAAGFDLANYKDNAAKTKFVDDLALANEELTNQDATSQDYIDTLVSTLTTDAAALTPKDINKADLKALIDASDLCTLDDYKEDSNWTTFQNALKDAKDVYNDATLKTIFQQGTVDDAKTVLQNAKNNLVGLDLCSYEALDTQLTRYAGLTEAYYTTDSWAEVNTAYTAANAVSRQLKATTANQELVNGKATALKNAIDNLKEADADYSKLQASYDTVKNYSQDDYKSGWANFNQALADAKVLLDNQTLKVKDQKTIDDAKTNLDNAAAALEAYGKADYTALKDAIDAKPTYYAQGTNYYNNWDAYADALDKAETLYNAGNLTAKDQNTIDTAKINLNTAKGNLSLKDADYTAVNTAKTAIPDDLAEYYTEDSIDTLNEVLEGINYNLKINDQETVTGYATAIDNAVKGLQLIAADTTELALAIANAENKKAEFYTADTFANMTTVLGQAQTLIATQGLTKKDNQSAVDQMTTDLNNAIAGLKSLGADYTELEAQIQAFKALTQANYTAASWSNANTKYLEADTVYKTPYSKEDQAIVTNAATALEDAIKALVEKDADYTALNNAKEAANDVITQSDAATVYTAKYLDGITTALADAAKIPTNLKVKDQQTIADAAKAINDAVDAVEYNKYDYTALNNLKIEWLGLAAKEDDYTVASWNAVEEAYNALVWDYTYEPTQYGLAKMQDASFEAVMKKLVKAQSANYGAVITAKQNAEALNEKDYTAASWADLKLALAKVDMNLNENHQAEVNQMATDINIAIANLAKLASYTDLDNKIAEADEFYKGTTNIYTTSTLNTLESAYTAAKNLSRVLTEDEQNQVDTALTDLTNALNGLKLKDADVTDLQAACDKFATYDEAKYTSATWNAYAQAVALGNKAINDKLDITKQNDINTLLANINDAEKNLAEKAVSGKGVFEGASGEVKDTRVANDFTFRVNARAIAIQFIDVYGNTWTFCRTDYKGRVAIKSYNDEGQLVGDVSEDLEYEDWTITQWLPIGEYTVRAKYGIVWDNENTQKMDVKAATPTDITIYSCDLAQTEGWTGTIPVTIVTGADIEAVQTITETDGTITTRSFTEEGGKRTFTTKAVCRNWGDTTVRVRVFYGCAWHEIDSLTYSAHK